MRKDEQQRQEPKYKYRVKNWPAYNAGLIARGDVVTIWMEPDLWQRGAEAGAVKRGRPCVYADAVIQMLLGLKQVFRLPLRALQGFAASMNKLAFADMPCPTTRRCAGVPGISMSCCRSCAAASRCIWWSTAPAEGVWRGRMEGAQARLFQAPHLAQGASGDGRGYSGLS